MIKDILSKAAGCSLILCMIFTSITSETVRQAFSNNNNNDSKSNSNNSSNNDNDKHFKNSDYNYSLLTQVDYFSTLAYYNCE